MTDVKEMKELIDKIRGSDPDTENRNKVDAILKAQKEIDDAKAKAEADAKSKQLDQIKAAEEKLKEDAIKEEAEKKKKAAEDKEGDEDEDEEEEEEETDEQKMDKLVSQMESMGKEIEALKKRKNYRSAPPKTKKVDAKDLPDFIVQNTQDIANQDFEIVV